MFKIVLQSSVVGGGRLEKAGGFLNVHPSEADSVTWVPVVMDC